MIILKRIYDSPEGGDGVRVLVDRVWPRGVKRELVDLWLRDLAPSDELRRWFNHDPEKWEEFRRKYYEELSRNPKVKVLLELIKKSDNVTLLYSAKSPYNNAVALKEYLEGLLTRGGT